MTIMLDLLYVPQCPTLGSILLLEVENIDICAHSPSQLLLFDQAGKTPYTNYTEDVSMSNQGGLLHRKMENKQVIHHANLVTTQ